MERSGLSAAGIGSTGSCPFSRQRGGVGGNSPWRQRPSTRTFIPKYWDFFGTGSANWSHCGCAMGVAAFVGSIGCSYIFDVVSF